MKLLGTLCTLLVATLLLGTLNMAQAESWNEVPEIAALFEKAGVSGTFVLSHPEENAWYGANQQRAETPFIPASTFKIINSLIGFETGVVDEQEVFVYDGQPRDFKAWEKDMNIREAIAVSNVPVYQEIARRIGLERMQQFLQEAHYGNALTGDQVDSFWLVGPLKISAIEQTRFLNSLIQQRSPFSITSLQKLYEIMPSEQGEKGKISFKTGWTGWDTPVTPRTGWLVGWVESEGRTYTFALNLEPQNKEDLALRLEIARDALKILGFF